MPDVETILEGAPSGEDGLLTIAAEVARSVGETLGVEACEVWLWRKSGDGEPRLERAGAFGKSLPGLNSHEAIRQISDRAIEGEGHSAVGDGQSSSNFMQVPIGLHGHMVIALDGVSVTQPMLDWLRRTAGDVAAAVARRLPHDELVEMNRWLLLRNEVDRRIARSFAKVRTLHELGRTIEEVADEMFAVEYSGIYFLDPDSGRLRLVHAKGLTEEERVAAERTAESRHPGHVLRTGEVIDVRDASQQPVEQGREPISHGRSILSRMFLPVRVDGVVVGTVGFASAHRDAYSTRHRQGLGFLADFAGLTYARIVAAHEKDRRGALLVASHAASERLLGALDWRGAAHASLALLGSALEAGRLALLELHPLPGRAGNPRPEEFIWQPVFGEPWPHALRLANLSVDEREHLSAGEALRIQFPPPGSPVMLKPVIIEGSLWGVLAFEPAADRHQNLDVGERAAIRSLANAFAVAIARERVDDSLRQRQKMEAVGMLASGLAKDLNNLLWPILLYTEMLERSVQLDARMSQMLTDIRGAARSATELVQQVLAISRRRDRFVERVDVSEAIAEATDLLRRAAPASVQLDVSIEPEVGEILGEPDCIQQVVTNLGARSIEVLRGRAGRLRVEASSLVRTNRRYVRIVVQDDGPGLDALARARLFEPYFPQQSGGDQAGAIEIGLSIVHRIVTGLDGTIAVQSEPTRGTRFEILIPAAQGLGSLPNRRPPRAVADETRQASARDSAEKTMRAADVLSRASDAAAARELVFVVDDDPSVLEVIRQMLEIAGYRVMAVGDPHEALRALSDPALPVALLVTDLTMPGMDGIELANKVRAMRPNLPIVCCTGHGDERSERRGTDSGLSVLIRKPIDLDAFTETIRSLLEARAG